MRAVWCVHCFDFRMLVVVVVVVLLMVVLLMVVLLLLPTAPPVVHEVHAMWQRRQRAHVSHTLKDPHVSNSPESSKQAVERWIAERTGDCFNCTRCFNCFRCHPGCCLLNHEIRCVEPGSRPWGCLLS